jgi:hypothetical protein
MAMAKVILTALQASWITLSNRVSTPSGWFPLSLAV